MTTTEIKQGKTGSIVILRGSTYPHSRPGGGAAAVHRSLNIEKVDERQLLLHIETNNT